MGILALARLLKRRSSCWFLSDMVPYPMSSMDLESTESSSKVTLSFWR